MNNEAGVVFTLFRIQVTKSEQLPLFSGDLDRKEIIVSAINEKPEMLISETLWHIGNINQFDNGRGLYFQVGKEVSKQQSVIDDESGDFLSEINLVAPNTPVVIDLLYQVAAIAGNPELAQDPRSVSNKIKRLMMASAIVKELQVDISIDPINDPMEFLEIVMAADAVTRFQVTYGLPNVWDAENDFQRPFQEAASKLGSTESTAKFKGDDLDRGAIRLLTRAASSVGKRAKAWVKKGLSSKAVPITQEENQVTFTSAPPTDSQDLRKQAQILEEVRTTYERVRQSE